MKKLNIFSLLALKGTIKILKALVDRRGLTFSELVEIIGQPSTTSRALKELLKYNLINRKVLDERYRPVMYSLTVDGRKLAEIVLMLIEFEKELNSKLNLA